MTSGKDRNNTTSTAAKVEVPLEGEALVEVCQGIMYAELAITDNSEHTLRNIAKTMPWHLEAMKLITGSEDQAHQPLTTILKQDLDGLELDCLLDVRGITKGGQFLDTQGYIAHNDNHIVVSFRCTTSAFDWLTNFNTTSSAWELEEDLAQGFSGFCSGFDDLLCTGGVYKPRVHTGFYNNFLAALPDIKKHVDPLLLETGTTRKLYVVGHSLGAGIATVAACYFITEYEWSTLPHELVIVTAGSPRSVCTSMQTVVDEKRRQHGKKCRIYRVVKGKDVVTCVPPKIFGFCHLADAIKITDDGLILLHTKDEDDPEADLTELSNCRGFSERNLELSSSASTDIADNLPSRGGYSQCKYDKMVARIPKALRDHMPDFYLKPMLRNLGLECGSTRPRETIAVMPEPQVVKKEETRNNNGKVKNRAAWMSFATFRSKRKTAPAFHTTTTIRSN
jgi:Lipase (class 3)